MQNNKIYVVTRDGDILQAFSVESDAKNYAEAVRGSAGDLGMHVYVEEIELDAMSLREGAKPFIVRMTSRGTVLEIKEETSQMRESVGFDISGSMVVVLFAIDENHATHRANQKRNELIKKDLWCVTLSD